MKHTDRELNTILDDVTAEIRNEKLDAAVVAGAAQRVQARLAGQQAAVEAGVAPVEHIRSCDDFRSLIPVYLQGQLSSARTMLLEDHTREFLPCRKALKEARHGRQSSWQLDSQKAKVTASNRRMKTVRWAVAAAVVVVVGLFAWPSAHSHGEKFRRHRQTGRRFVDRNARTVGIFGDERFRRNNDQSGSRTGHCRSG